VFTVVSPFPFEHLPKMWSWLQHFDALMVDDYCPKSFEEMAEKNKRDLANGAKTYAIMSDGQPVGAVWGEFVGDGVYIGHLVFDRYTLTSSEKMQLARMALKQFFADGARKIQWQLYADNRAFRVFLKRMGASVEGILKQATRCKGELRDMMLMASFPEEIQ
jgi:hypothetical protein